MALPGLYCPAAAAALRYRANAVSFDGANDYLTRGAGLTGAADSKLVTFSFWINKHGSDGATERVLASAHTVGGADNLTRISKGNTDDIGFIGRNTTDTGNAISVTSSANVAEITDGWVHAMGSFDVSDTAKRHLFINDVADLATVVAYNDTEIEFTLGDWSIGADPDATNKLNGDLGDVLLWPGVYVDLSLEANRRLFVSADLKPIDPAIAIAALGAPLVRLSGPTVDWHTNKGTGGGFTVHGALSDVPNGPSD
jgi:hypothetical protein